MTDLTTIQAGDLLKTTYNQEPGWFLVQAIDLGAQTASGRFLPGVGTGQRHCNPATFTATALEVVSKLVHPHGKSTVFEALSAAVGVRAAVALLK